jgi:hypothetical protein
LTRLHIAGFVVLGLLMHGSAVAQSNGTTKVKHPVTRILEVDWAHRDAKLLNDSLKEYRLVEGDTLIVRVKHLNFLKYTVSLKAESVAIESYREGNTIWSAVFGLVPVFGAAADTPPGTETPFRKAYRQWYTRVEAAQTLLVSFTSDTVFAKEAFDVANASDVAAEKRIVDAANNIPQSVTQMAEARAEALKVASSREDFQDYDKLAQIHDALIVKVSDFQSRAQLVRDGQVLSVPPQKTGHLVTLTLTSKDRVTANDSNTLAVTYFVRSIHPLVFHTGYAVSSLDKLSFDQVRGLGGQDLYTVVSDSSATSDLVSFLSYEFWNGGPNGRYGVLATIGVPVTAPTSGVIAGGSVRVFSRLLLNVGVFIARLDEGVDPAEEPIEGTSQTRTVFGGLTTKYDFAPSYSVSFRVF